MGSRSVWLVEVQGRKHGQIDHREIKYLRKLSVPWGVMAKFDHNHWHSQCAFCVLGKIHFRIRYLRHIFQLARCQNRGSTINNHSSEESVFLNFTRSMRRAIIHNFILLLKLRHRWEGNIKMVLKEMGWEGMDRTALAKDRDSWRTFVNAVMNNWVPENAGNFLNSWEPVTFSGKTAPWS